MSLESLGADLKAAREKRALSLDQIANETRISLRHLGSIEAGHFSDLPGGLYNRAFLRAYCEAIAVDPQAYLSQYEALSSSPSERAAKARPKPPGLDHPVRRVPSLVVWCAMLLVSVVGLYATRRWIAAVFSPYFTQRYPSPAAEPVRPASDPVRAAIVPAAQPTGAAAPAASIPAPPAPPVAETPAAPPPEPAAGLRLEFQVLAKCWVSVEADGNRVLVKLLEPGDDQTFEASERVYLKLGNAGGVRVRINGKPAKPLGASGEVVAVLITKQNLEQFFVH